jgi:hypothetical protein
MASCRRSPRPAGRGSVRRRVPRTSTASRETAAWREAWTTTETPLGHLQARVGRSGARFAVALGPAGLEYDPTMRFEWLRPGPVPPRDFEYPYRRLAALLDRERIPWISLLPALRAHHEATGRSGCYAWDGHWDPEGHAVVAAALRGLVGELVASGGSERDSLLLATSASSRPTAGPHALRRLLYPRASGTLTLY